MIKNIHISIDLRNIYLKLTFKGSQEYFFFKFLYYNREMNFHILIVHSSIIADLKIIKMILIYFYFKLSTHI